MALWDEILGPHNDSQWAWVWDGQRYVRESYTSTFAEARRVAAALRHKGISRGGVVGAVITNSPQAVHGFLGCWFAGARIASLPIIARGQSLPDYVAQLNRLCAATGAECLLIEERYAPFLTDVGFGGGKPLITWEALKGSDLAEFDPLEEDETVFIQFSSGTTAEPRGVELTGRAIDAQLRTLGNRLAIDPERDVGLMWLPLSHDMGFFGGIVLAWYTGMRGVLATPERFLTAPWTWFDDCARLDATLTVAPSFAYLLAARVGRHRPLPGPLSLRLCLTGGEQVVSSHLSACVSTFQSLGLSLSAFASAYGLAEATLAVAIGDITQPPHSVWIDPAAAFEGELSLGEPDDAQRREVVSCGRALEGFGVSYENEVDELHVSGPSLAAGYHGQPELTAARFAGGQFATGDLGFVHQGELYIVGRLDDRLIVGGRNVDVAQLEHEIAADSRVRKGNCAIVDVRSAGTQRIVLVAEGTSSAQPRELLGDVRALAARRHGLRIDRVVMLADGEFPKTPSGKVQRFRCRELAASRTMS